MVVSFSFVLLLLLLDHKTNFEKSTWQPFGSQFGLWW